MDNLKYKLKSLPSETEGMYQNNLSKNSLKIPQDFLRNIKENA